MKKALVKTLLLLSKKSLWLSLATMILSIVVFFGTPQWLLNIHWVYTLTQCMFFGGCVQFPIVCIWVGETVDAEMRQLFRSRRK